MATQSPLWRKERTLRLLASPSRLWDRVPDSSRWLASLRGKLASNNRLRLDAFLCCNLFTHGRQSIDTSLGGKFRDSTHVREIIRCDLPNVK